MKSFMPEYLNQLHITPEMVLLIGQIREYKGKQQLYAERKPEVLESLRQMAFIESVESSNRLERIETSRKVLKALLEHKQSPVKRPQTELAGYRDALQTIHNYYSDMTFNASLIRQLHRDMLQYTATPGGEYKNSPNDIVEKDDKGNILQVRFRTVAPHLTPQAMEDLNQGYRHALQQHDPLILIPNYVHDFLCIHPFMDGNGRIARLITVLLLYKNGFDVGRYISLEKQVEDSKESYYESLALSDAGWERGEHNHTHFTTYLLGVILAAYRRLEADIENIQTGKGYKTNLVKKAIASLPEHFSISDIENHCPSVSRDTIRNVLQKLSSEELIESVGKGRSAYWRKLGEDYH